MSPLRPVVAAGATFALLAMLAVGATTASAEGPPNPAATCSGMLPAGSFSSLTVQGLCIFPTTGTVHIDRNVTITPGSVLLANYPALPGVGEGDAEVTIGRNVMVGSGATLVLGCTPSAGCVNTTHDTVGGNLVSTQPLGVLVHGDAIQGNVIHSGGGGGVNCNPVGFFAAIGEPAFSAYEDGTVGGNVVITGMESCWLGLARVQVGNNAIFQSNNLADPDAIEILSNTISHNLICQGNSMVWNSAEADPEGGLFPRIPEPNTVGHQRIGQCVLASPTTPGGPLGPGPF